jgi:hypothetical protein
MKAASVKTVRCAIYTRVSTDHGLDQEFKLAGCAVRSLVSLYQEPSPRRLDSDQGTL